METQRHDVRTRLWRILEAEMPMPATVSVCVPLYNGEAWLDACLQSVLAQSFPDFELLLVDDGSDDHTAAICEHYCARDTRVRYLRNTERAGLPGNWNRCVALARGEFVKFLFQDDLLEPRCLELMVHAGRKHPFVSCRREFLLEPGSASLRGVFEHFSQRECLAHLAPDCDFVDPARLARLSLERLGSNFIGEPCFVMLRRSLLERFGRFNPELVQMADIEMWMRIGQHSGVLHIPEVLARFRVHGGSATRSNHAQRQFRTRWLDPLLIRHELAYSPLWLPMRRAALASTPPQYPVWRFAVEAERVRRLARDSEEAWRALQKLGQSYPRLLSARAWPLQRSFELLRERWRAVGKPTDPA